MPLALNVATTVPQAVNTAYVVTRPAGCTPPTSNLTTNAVSIDYLDLGTLGVAPKGVSLRVVPTPTAGGHVGIVFNAFGNQPVAPAIFGAGVGFWTYGNGLYFDANGSIYIESWHTDPGTTEASGAWLDTLIAGTWLVGHTYQVDATLYADGHYVFRVLDLGYKLTADPVPNPHAMPRFFSTNASPTDPSVPVRIRAKSTQGRTNKIFIFNAGIGSGMVVTPIGIFN